MQYNADYEETDQEDQCFLYLRGTVFDNVEKIKYLGITITNDLKWNTHMSATFVQRSMRPLVSFDVTWRHVQRMLKSQHTRDWCVQSWSMVVQSGTPKKYFRIFLGLTYRGLSGRFHLLRNFSVAISVSPHVCFILVLILISMFLR